MPDNPFGNPFSNPFLSEEQLAQNGFHPTEPHDCTKTRDMPGERDRHHDAEFGRSYDASKTVKPIFRPRGGAGSGGVLPRGYRPTLRPCPVCAGNLDLQYYCENCDIKFCSACMKPMSHDCCTDRSCPAYAEPCDKSGRPVPSANLSGCDFDNLCDRCGRKVCANCGSFPQDGNYDFLCRECAQLCRPDESEE